MGKKDHDEIFIENPTLVEICLAASSAENGKNIEHVIIAFVYVKLFFAHKSLKCNHLCVQMYLLLKNLTTKSAV